MLAKDIEKSEHAPYYGGYILKSGSLSLSETLEASKTETEAFFKTIPESKLEYRYMEGKWTIKEVLQHIIDTERIMSYRALCFARQDKASLPGYDENDYTATSFANRLTIAELLNEYSALRTANIALFKNFSNQMLMQIGTANNSPMSVRAIGFIIAGHEKHHIDVVKQRYL
ncbi:DinB family protein [Bizionia sp. KMM 8389]